VVLRAAAKVVCTVRVVQWKMQGQTTLKFQQICSSVDCKPVLKQTYGENREDKCIDYISGGKTMEFGLIKLSYVDYRWTHVCLCILCSMDWFLLASLSYGFFMRRKSSVLVSVNDSNSLYRPYTFPRRI